MFVAIDRITHFSSVAAEYPDLLNERLCESFGARGPAGTSHSYGVRGAVPLGHYKHSTPTEFYPSRRALNSTAFGWAVPRCVTSASQRLIG